MLDAEVIELLNSRELWGFIGSGTSIDAGMPDWESLVHSILVILNPDVRRRLAGDGDFKAALAARHFPRALARVVFEAGRPSTIQALAQCLSEPRSPGSLTQAVARWPFKSYIGCPLGITMTIRASQLETLGMLYGIFMAA
jgi:hypothetical protein